jgi:hypothetical protein
MAASHQHIRIPEENRRRTLSLLRGENRAEIGVCRDHNTVLSEGPCARADMNSVVSHRQREVSHAWWQCVVDQESHTEEGTMRFE